MGWVEERQCRSAEQAVVVPQISVGEQSASELDGDEGPDPVRSFVCSKAFWRYSTGFNGSHCLEPSDTEAEAAVAASKSPFSTSMAVKCAISRLHKAAWPLCLVAQAPTPSFTARNCWPHTSTASSPLVIPFTYCPSTDGRGSRLREWVVRGSEKDPDGRERKGGGNGREGRFAKVAYPVSK
jgi:hypothetical protein